MQRVVRGERSGVRHVQCVKRWCCVLYVVDDDDDDDEVAEQQDENERVHELQCHAHRRHDMVDKKWYHRWQWNWDDVYVHVDLVNDRFVVRQAPTKRLSHSFPY